MKWLKTNRVWLVGAATILAIVLLFVSSESFQNCVNAKNNADAENAFYKSVSNFLVFGGILRGCTGYFVDRAGNAITALSTVLIAIFTWTLWRTSISQGEATQQSIDLARDEFNAAHRPQLDIRLIRRIGFTKGLPIEIEWTVINIGTGRGKIVESNATAIFATEPLPALPPYSSDARTMNSVMLANDGWIDPGFGGTIRQHFNMSVPDWVAYDVSQERDMIRQKLYFIGYVLYEDSDSGRRSVAFCRRYEPSSERFVVVNDPNYEHRA